MTALKKDEETDIIFSLLPIIIQLSAIGLNMKPTDASEKEKRFLPELWGWPESISL